MSRPGYDDDLLSKAILAYFGKTQTWAALDQISSFEISRINLWQSSGKGKPEKLLMVFVIAACGSNWVQSGSDGATDRYIGGNSHGERSQTGREESNPHKDMNPIELLHRAKEISRALGHPELDANLSALEREISDVLKQKGEADQRWMRMHGVSDRIAHEIGECLVPLSTHQQLLASEIHDPDFRESLNRALSDNVRQIARLARFLRCSRGLQPEEAEPGRLQSVRLEGVVSSALQSSWTNLKMVRFVQNVPDDLYVWGKTGPLVEAVRSILELSIRAVGSRRESTIWINGQIRSEKVALVIRHNGPAKPHDRVGFFGQGFGFIAEQSCRSTVEEFQGTLSVGTELGVTSFILSFPRRLPMPFDRSSLSVWVEHQISLDTLSTPLDREALKAHCRSLIGSSEPLTEWVSFSREARLLWRGLVKPVNDLSKLDGHAQRPVVPASQYHPSLKEMFDRNEVPANGSTPVPPDEVAFRLAGGVVPVTEAGERWRLRHLYDGTTPFEGRFDSLCAQNDGDHFTQSAGIVAIRPDIDAKFWHWGSFVKVLRFLAFERFGYDPDQYFCDEAGEHDAFGFVRNGRGKR